VVEVSIEVDVDMLFLLLVEIVGATKQTHHLDNFDDNQSKAGTLLIAYKECES